ncbi:MAG: saccharopine dehydrogenase [Gammaproteobacteria bacterium RIFCSPHIGHO2_12_FULL_40_19]|nr:MAG: saccharopine dehydrogenase [Gammaproteobacteria bacterium RIFCSPHIGHO2_12_FULL_40_19]
MHHILVIGAGKIGSLIAHMLSHSSHYFVCLADKQANTPNLRRLKNLPNYKFIQLNADDVNEISEVIKTHQIEAIISSLPYYCNVPIAKVAATHHLHYFDLTEDVQTAQDIRHLAKNAKGAFVSQCGLAPGVISIIANHLMKNFPELDTVKLRVGALPINISNALQYSLTWSTDGLINEYGNLCHAIENGKEVSLLPLEGLEEVKIDGLTYEAFNTSGGLGSLAKTYYGKVKHLSYKTIRYPGHCSKIKFLMNDLKLNDDRDALKKIFERALPKTFQDVVLVYISVTGTKESQFIEESYVKKFYSKKLEKYRWSAIQLTTASGICAIVDIVLNNVDKYHGFVVQEEFSFDELVSNQFGSFYA